MAELKKGAVRVTHGVVHIQSTFNNTIVSVTDKQGNVLSWAAAGTCGFKGSRKSTPYAAQVATETAIKKAMDAAGLTTVDVLVKGPGAGKETAIRTVKAVGLEIDKLKDITPVPHNGCRPRKRRRV
ncbi:MAG: 30S ribosomal protein S11 [Candidatus Wallbacteria bacterium]